MSLRNFDRTLSWNDFTKIPSLPDTDEKNKREKPEEATVSVTFDIDAPYERVGKAIGPGKYVVNIIFIKENSTVTSTKAAGKESAELLKHEQGHYDIMALGAREFHNKVASLKAETEIELDKKIADIRIEIGNRTDFVDARYDTDTNHSKNKERQKLWDGKIEAAKKNKNGTVDQLPG